MTASGFTHQIKTTVLDWGTDLVGVADAEPLKALDVNPPDLLSGFTRVISIAVQLPLSAFETITDKPTPIYGAVYQTANRILDELAFKTAVVLQNEGFRSLPIPASQVLDRNAWQGAISHKAVARMAGLGWQGKKSAADHARVWAPGAPGQHTHRGSPGSRWPGRKSLRGLHLVPGCLPGQSHQGGEDRQPL